MRRRLIGIAALIFALGAARLASAGAAKAGPEFLVNTYTTSSQFEPSLGFDATGRFVVVWGSYYQDGSYSGVFAQRFDSAGARLGVEFQVNTYTTNGQRSGAVGVDAAGNFVVVWQSYPQDGSGTGVFARRFNSSGASLGGEFQVNTYTTNFQFYPSVAMNASGAFVVVWTSSYQDGDGGGVFGQRFDSSGVAAGGEFQVNTYTTGYQSRALVAVAPAGNFVVAWDSYRQDGSGLGIFARRFDSAGTPGGGEFQVNTYTTSSQLFATVAIDANSRFAVAWTDYGHEDGSSSGVFARRFDSAGSPLSAEFQVNTFTTSYQSRPTIGMNAAGAFVVTWQSYPQDGSGTAVFGQRYDPTGAAAGAEFQVNTYTTNNQYMPAVALRSSGDFVIAWTSYFQDGANAGIFAQRFAPTFTLTSPKASATLSCHPPILVGPTFAWDAAGYDVFRVLMSPVPGFLKGAVVTSGTKLLKSSTYLVPTTKWQSACSKALTADPNNPILFIEVFGVDKSLPKSDVNRKKFTPAIQVTVTP
ncbi:MAG: hypothetical protein HY049_15135 [Acidobacteria bacterium]|nr:hypothetical protein [Acidobacteriota bacterium]